MDKPLYKPFKYKGKGKFKMSVYVKNDKGGKKIIHFGHSDYKHNYSVKARQAYLARAKGIRNKKNELTWKLKDTRNYWSTHYLWNA